MFEEEKEKKQIVNNIDKCIAMIESLVIKTSAQATLIEKFQSEDHFRNVYDLKLSNKIWKLVYSNDCVEKVKQENLVYGKNVSMTKVVQEVYNKLIKKNSTCTDAYIKQLILEEIDLQTLK